VKHALRAAAVSLLLALPSLAFADFSYGAITYTDIADTFNGSDNSQLGFFPAINNAGQIAYTNLSTTTVEHVYLAPASPGPALTILDGATGYNSFTSLSLNNTGTVAFGARYTTGPGAPANGLFTGSGGALSTVADATTSIRPYSTGETPRINDNGQLSFVGNAATQVIATKTGNTFATVVANDGHQFEFLYDDAINNAGQVAFNTDDYINSTNNGAFVYRYTPGAGLITVSRAASTTSVAINDNGFVAFQAAGGSGNATLGLFASDGAATTHISDIHQNLPGTSILIDSYAANGEGTPINNNGLVAFQASDNASANYGIYVGDGTNTTQILRRGQTLFGKTVRDFELGRDAINDSGQVTFWVSFTDNTAAIVRTSAAVPEPTTALLCLPPVLALFLRRRPK
jgi:hypothetical protein